MDKTLPAQSLPDAVAALEADFALLDDWEDRYGYVIELGKALAPLPDALKSEQNRVRGCVSQVWLNAEASGAPARLWFQGESDSHLVRGLVAVMIGLLSGRTAAEIAALDAEALLRRLGFSEALTPQRSNGLRALIARMQARAAEAL